MPNVITTESSVLKMAVLPPNITDIIEVMIFTVNAKLLTRTDQTDLITWNKKLKEI